MVSPADQATLFLGRQPILDRDQALLGYELLFRSDDRNAAHLSSPRQATADVVCKAFAELGMANALGNQRGFINVGRDLLFSDALELLPAQSVVLEIQSDDVLDDETRGRCRALHGNGYQIALSGNAHLTAAAQTLAGTATYVKINVKDANYTAHLAPALRSGGARLIATCVESRADLARCEAAGFDYFQGYYFAEPTIVEGRRLEPGTQTLLRLIALLNADADTGELEPLFKHEPALTINLLRLVNSVGAGLASRIGSVRHAITALGRRQLQRWLQLLVFAQTKGHSDLARNPLMQLAALRGYFLELLAAKGHPDKPDLRDQAFLVGIMSLMPSALGIPMTEILGQIAVSADVRRALSRQEGDLGRLLALTECYDNNDMPGTASLLAQGSSSPRALSPRDLAESLTEAIAWVQQLGTEAD